MARHRKYNISLTDDELNKLKYELSAWEMERNRDTAKIQWHFQTGDAREKLISLYPTLSSVTF